MHATSSGKALLSVLSEDERQKWFKTYPGFASYTETTLTSQAAFDRDLQAGIQRGWQRSLGENVEDVMSISLGFRAYEQPFAIVVAGPLGRMQKNEATTGQQLKEVKALLYAALPSANLTFVGEDSR